LSDAVPAGWSATLTPASASLAPGSHCAGVVAARRAGIGRGHANVHRQPSRKRDRIYRRGFKDARRGGGTGRRRLDRQGRSSRLAAAEENRYRKRAS